MKRISPKFTAFRSLLIVMISLFLASPVVAQIQTSPSVDAGAEIETLLRNMARDFTDFTRVREIQAILRYYSPDYTKVAEGKVKTLNDRKATLIDIQEKLDLGAQIGISFRIGEIKANVIGNTAWAMYTYTEKIGAGGTALSAEDGITTAILSKRPSGWVILHEHNTIIKESEPAQTENTANGSPVNSILTSSIAAAQELDIVSGSFSVEESKSTDIKFTLTRDSKVTGTFQASGGAGNDIHVYIFDEAAYTHWKGGGEAKVWYNSGRQAFGEVDISLPAGNYYIIFSNTFSVLTAKVVTASIVAN